MTLSKDDYANVWLGLAEVAPALGNCLFEREAKGGFVNGLAYAKDESEFRDKFARTLVEYGVRVIAIESATPLGEVLARKDVEPALIEALQLLQPDENARLGNLYCFYEEGDA